MNTFILTIKIQNSHGNGFCLVLDIYLGLWKIFSVCMVLCVKENKDN